MSGISELLEYLRKEADKHPGSVEAPIFREWATAVEYVQEENRELVDSLIRYASKIEAYERILDKNFLLDNKIRLTSERVIAEALRLISAYQDKPLNNRGKSAESQHLNLPARCHCGHERGRHMIEGQRNCYDCTCSAWRVNTSYMPLSVDNTAKPTEYGVVNSEEFAVSGDLRAAYKYLKDHFNRGESEDKVEPNECHCGKNGHALNSINCPVHGDKVEKPVLHYADSHWSCLLCDGKWQGADAAIKHMLSNHGVEINRGQS